MGNIITMAFRQVLNRFTIWEATWSHGEKIEERLEARKASRLGLYAHRGIKFI